MGEYERDPPPKEQEHEDIRAVYGYIQENGPVRTPAIVEAEPGPSTAADLAEMGLTRERQVKRIVYNLDRTDQIRWQQEGWVVADGE